MSPKLTDEMRSAIRQQAGRPVTVQDEESQRLYVLLPLDLYERLQAIFGDGMFDIDETYAAQSKTAGAAGWDDPEMSVYDE